MFTSAVVVLYTSSLDLLTSLANNFSKGLIFSPCSFASNADIRFS
jgi:hypothetical protein